MKVGLTAGQFLGEAVSWYLGRVLGARLPDAGAVLWGHPPSWGMELVGSRNWVAGDQSLVIDPGELAAMVVLDVLVWNHDRHSDNIVVHDTRDGAVIPYAIDHADVRMIEPSPIDPLLVECAPDVSTAAYSDLQAPPPTLPWELLFERMPQAIERLRGSMQRNVAALDNYVRHACDLAEAPQRHPEISAALYARTAVLGELVGRHRLTVTQFFRALKALNAKFEPITQEDIAWPLPSA